MCEPTTIALGVSAGVSLIGGVMAKRAADAEGEAAQNAAEYNAAETERGIRDTYRMAGEEVQDLGIDARRGVAAGRTEYAGGNIALGEGSAMDWSSDALDTYYADVDQVQENTRGQVTGSKKQAALQRAGGANANIAAQSAGNRSLLSGVAGAAKAGAGSYSAWQAR